MDNTRREIQVDKYKSENTNRTNANREVPFGIYKTENTNRKIQLGEIQNGRYTSEDTTQKIKAGGGGYKSQKHTSKNKSEDVSRDIQIGKYKSENTSR